MTAPGLASAQGERKQAGHRDKGSKDPSKATSGLEPAKKRAEPPGTCSQPVAIRLWEGKARRRPGERACEKGKRGLGSGDRTGWGCPGR